MKKLVYLFLLATMTAIGQTVPSYVPTTGLLGWWPFNGNANDESGNNRNGQIFNAINSTDRFGNNNSSFQFNGLNTYILITDASFLTANYSLSVWFQSFGGFCPTTGAVLRSGGGACDGKGFAISNSANETKFGFNEFSNSNAGIFTFQSSLPCSSFQSNAWHNLTVTRSGNLIIQYLDGQIIDSALSTYTPSTSCPIYIGSNHLINGSSWNVFTGKVDDLAIWNRSLSAIEVSHLYFECVDSLLNQPQHYVANSNLGLAYFNCTSSDSSATYLWQQNAGTGWANINNFGNYSGATSDSLVITGVTTAMNNYGYRCIVTGCSTDTSDVAILTVTNGIGLGEAILDKLTISPNPTTGLISLNSEFSGTYELLSLDGRLVESGEIKKVYDLSQQPNGVYNLRLRTAEGTRIFKIVKQ